MRIYDGNVPRVRELITEYMKNLLVSETSARYEEMAYKCTNHMSGTIIKADAKSAQPSKKQPWFTYVFDIWHRGP